MTQHSSLSPERWAAFNLDQQILMIGNEMNRAMRLMLPEDRERLMLAYERVLRLTDLTIEVNPRPTLRRELLRWRDLIAELYIQPPSDPMGHSSAFRALLLFTPTASQQIPFVLGAAAST
ncbi:MAG TPA: hypothetical protein VN851_21620 [Thermoanaerobaculia bacterium]|nr:hypothetical protein [Thermoanaerobaculia bacterium]